LIPLPAMQRFLGGLWMTRRRQLARTAAWLPWLGLALLVAAALAPGTVTAGQLAFQSPEEPTPIPPTPTIALPTDTPTPLPPTPIPLPPTPTLPPPAPPTPTPEVPAPVEAPTQPPPTQAIPTQELAPTLEQPTQPAPPPVVEPTQPPPTPPEATSPAQATATPRPAPAPQQRPPASAEDDQPVVNWVKFWDTVAVLLAYPWLCCGVGLLLLVPLLLLFLEIKGRRPPPRPPEPLGVRKKRDKE